MLLGTQADYPPVYLHLIFEISSVTRFFFQFRNIKFKKFKKSIWFRNWFLQATQAVKIKFELEKKIKFDSKSIFFRVCNKLPNWHFKNQAQIDTANVFGHFLEDGTKIKIPSDILDTLSAVDNLETYYNVL